MFRPYSLATSIFKNNTLWNSNRRLSTIKDINFHLPNLTSRIFPHHNGQDHLKIKTDVCNQINHEFQFNRIARGILSGTESLLQSGQLQITQGQCIKEDQHKLDTIKALRFYDTETKTIYLPSDVDVPYKLTPLQTSASYNPHKNYISHFVGGLLHECTHAVDGLLAKLETSEKNVKAIAADDWISSGLDIHFYDKEALNHLTQALIIDKKQLEIQAATQTDKDAQRILHFLNLIDAAIPSMHYIDEAKAYFVQFSVKGALEISLMERYMPNTFNWFEKEFLPKIEITPVMSSKP